MKKALFIFSFVLIFVGVFLLTKDSIFSFIKGSVTGSNKEIKLDNINDYYRDYDFMFVQTTDNFRPKSKQDILNIYYTVINSGVNSFTFYCDDEYTSCIDDVENLANDQSMLSDINNYVHPFNSFSDIATEYSKGGKVTVDITKVYTDEEIAQINDKVSELTSYLVNGDDSLYNNIMRIHDYIINNSKYDSARSDNGDTTYKSDTAYGPLFQGFAICGGYSDLMELFLERLSVKSFKVSSDEHVWNALLFNDNWVNLDLTWDDPVVDDGSDYLEHNYFMIPSSQLVTMEQTEHNFDVSHYPELSY